MSKVSSAMTELNLTKPQMINVIIILMDLDAEVAFPQFSKLSIQMLNLMYDKLNSNAIACKKAEDEARFAREHAKVDAARIRSLEKELNKIKRRTK